MRLVMCARIMKPTFSVHSVAIHLWSRKTAMKAPRPSAVGRSLCMVGMHTASRVTGRDAKDSKLVNFTDAADGVTHLDSSELSIEQTVTAVMDLVLRAVPELA